jgi:hypothetical protein
MCPLIDSTVTDSHKTDGQPQTDINQTSTPHDTRKKRKAVFGELAV